MSLPNVTVEAPYGLLPVHDDAPTYKVCTGIDTMHALGDASLYVSFVRSYFRMCMDNDAMPGLDEIAVLDHLLEEAQALRRASGTD